MGNAASRIVITGAGLISPIGKTLEAVWESLSQQRSGIGPLTVLPTEHLPTRVAAEASDFTGSIDDFGPLEKKLARTIKKGLKVMCREIEMGVAAAQLALHHAGVEPESHDPNRVGVIFGSDYILTLPDEFAAGIRKCLNEAGEFEFDRWATDGLPQVQPLWLLKYLPNMPASHIAIYNDFRGPNNSITLREPSANLAVAEAMTTLQRGWADMILAGATGTRVHQLRSLHVLLQEQIAPGDEDPATSCRPFDLGRTGMVLGEGAATIMVETLESARKRNATILGELVGYASSAVVNSKGVGDYRQAIYNVLKQSTAMAGIEASQLGHIHAHGLGTSRSDREEAIGIRDFLDDAQVPVVAAKSYLGNPGAAGGLIELVTSLLALQHDELFPTLNHQQTDPECPIHVMTEPGKPGDSFVNLSLSLQGQASAVVVKRFEDA